MIAPIKQSEDPPRSPGVRHAHRLVASAFLRERKHRAETAPSVPGWQAWLFVAWVVLATAAYAGYMIGLF
jgi:hypothetical protein